MSAHAYRLWLPEPTAPAMVEQLYVGETMRISGFGDRDGTYEVVRRKPLANGLDLELVHQDLADSDD